MKRSGWTRFLALCLAVISLSMLVSGGLGIRAANKDRRKSESELQDLRSRIDEYRQISAALMDRASYENLNRSLEEKQEKYNADTARHRADLSTYTATNSGLEMGTAALNQAESALENGKTQYEMGLKALNRSMNAIGRFSGMIDSAGVTQARDKTDGIFAAAENLLRDGDPNNGDPGGSLYQLEQAILELSSRIKNDLSEETDKDQTADAAEGAAPDDGNHPGGDPSGGATDPEQGDLTENNGEEEKPEQTQTPGDDPVDPADPGQDGNVTEDGEQTPEEAGFQEPEDTDPPADPTDNPEPEQGSAESASVPVQTPEEPQPPLSPKTGEENDASGMLTEAIGNVILAEKAVLKDIGEILSLAEGIKLPTDIAQTVLNSAGVENTEELRNLIVDTIHESGIVLKPEQGEALGEMLQLLESADEMTDTVATQLQALSETADAAGDETDELMQLLRTAAGMSEETEDESVPVEKRIEEIHAAYRSDPAKVAEAFDSLADAIHLFGEKRNEYYKKVQEAHTLVKRVFGLVGQLSGAKATLDQTLSAMKEMGAQIEEGEAALAEGRAKIDAAKDEQKKKAEELDKKKRDLDAQEKALKQSGELVEEQKSLEEREKTLRSALLAREEIHRRSEAGEELLPASERWLTEYAEQTARRYRDRFNASLLMILAAVLAVAGALTSFGKSRRHVFTMLLTLLCLASSISAAFLLYRMGRGISWSAAVTAVIAAAELLFLLPSLRNS